MSVYKFSDGRYYDAKGRSLKGMFIPYPLRFTKISSPFGRRYHPTLHRYKMHEGIDFVNKTGTPIHTVADGKVIYKGWMHGYGKTVKIKHANGYITLYAHLHGYAHITKNQYIKRGKVIGYLGNTGRSTGPHLHFGVMLNNKWINPSRIKRSAKVVLYGERKKQFLAFKKSIEHKSAQAKVAMK